MSQRFHIHWSVVDEPAAAAYTQPNCDLIALWPAPVNHDVCFAEAGFANFGDNDQDWDLAAEGLLRRVISKLTAHGAANLMSQQLREHLPWYLRLFRSAEPLPLLEQVLQPIHWDSLTHCHITFGEQGAALRTGNGHFLLWLTMPRHEASSPSNFVNEVAGSTPVTRTELKWQALL